VLCFVASGAIASSLRFQTSKFVCLDNEQTWENGIKPDSWDKIKRNIRDAPHEASCAFM